MTGKFYTHKLTMNDRRRMNKQTSDARKPGVPKAALQEVFNNFYKDQLRALYRVVSKER